VPVTLETVSTMEEMRVTQSGHCTQTKRLKDVYLTLLDLVGRRARYPVSEVRVGIPIYIRIRIYTRALERVLMRACMRQHAQQRQLYSPLPAVSR
jgi:hypothetical protein